MFCPSERKENRLPTIVSVTRMEKRRGGDFLPLIVKKVLERNKNVRFIIAGGGSLFNSFREQMEKSDLIDFSEIFSTLQTRPNM